MNGRAEAHRKAYAKLDEPIQKRTISRTAIWSNGRENGRRSFEETDENTVGGEKCDRCGDLY